MPVLFPPGRKMLEAGDDTLVRVEVEQSFYPGNMPAAGFQFGGFGTLIPTDLNVIPAAPAYRVLAEGSGLPVLARISVNNALPPERGDPIEAQMGPNNANVIFHTGETRLMPGDYEMVV